ncbi:hypothetical protein LguiA_024749 [Lonicera macranthoides]
MDYPYGHPDHRPQHHHRRDEEEEKYPKPAFEAPPPPYHEYDAPPPPPHSSHNSHYGGGGEPTFYAPPPPQPSYAPPPHQASYAPPPPHSSSPVQHETENNPHHHRPHMPSFVEKHAHHSDPTTHNNKPTVRVYSKAEPDYSLSIRDGKVILTRSDPSDPCQHWIKDEKLSTKVKDEQGYPSFALVNKATGLAIKHSIGATHPVQLTPYNTDILDESVLWTESKDLGDGYRTIRMVNNIKLNVDALNGDKNHGGVHEGTTIVLWEWKKGENQRWKIVPYCKSFENTSLQYHDCVLMLQISV